MASYITEAGSFLVKKLGKDIALAFMFGVSKFALFLMVSAFVGTMISFVTTFYGIVQEYLGLFTSLADGSLGSTTPCVGILASAFANQIGFIDAVNSVGPTIILVYFTYFNVYLLGVSIGIYRYINNSILEFAMVIK